MSAHKALAYGVIRGSCLGVGDMFRESRLLPVFRLVVLVVVVGVKSSESCSKSTAAEYLCAIGHLDIVKRWARLTGSSIQNNQCRSNKRTEETSNCCPTRRPLVNPVKTAQGWS